MRDEVVAANAVKDFVLGNFEEVEGPLESKCWMWMGDSDMQGYGRVKFNGDWYKAHRLAWVIANGAIPKGLKALHRCDKTWCIRVEHLFVDTQARNVEDMIEKGRHARGERQGRAGVSDAEVANLKGLLQERWDGIINELADRCNLTYSIVYGIATGRTFRHIEPSSSPVMPPSKVLPIKRRKGL